MITQTELLEQLAATFGKNKVNKLTKILKEQNFALRDLIVLSFNADKTIAFRAAWLLENVFISKPDVSLADIEFLLARFTAVKFPSCQRHYAKIIMHLTSAKAKSYMQFKLQAVDLQPVVERCFDWLIDPQVMIAVKAHAAEALFNLRLRYPWIAEELPAQLEFLMKNGTAAIQTRGRRLLSQL